MIIMGYSNLITLDCNSVHIQMIRICAVISNDNTRSTDVIWGYYVRPKVQDRCVSLRKFIRKRGGTMSGRDDYLTRPLTVRK